MHMTDPVTVLDESMNVVDDSQSRLGRFMWTIVGSSCIPCLLKSNGTKYVAVRIAESKVLAHFLFRLNAEVFNCVSVKSFGITEAEMKLLNEINQKHCEFAFGRDLFSMDTDFIVKLEDLVEFYTFMDTCYNKLLNQQPSGCKNKCGFVRINDDSVVPYAMKDDQKYVPLFYFEGETDSLRTKAINLENWDLAYLKFCCKVQGIKNELFASEQCLVTSLEDVKSYFPEGTRFDDYWPAKVVEMQTPTRNDSSGNHCWVQTPRVDSVTVPQTGANTVHLMVAKSLPPIVPKPVHNQRVNNASVINNLPNSGYSQGVTWQNSNLGNSLNSVQSGAYVSSVTPQTRIAPKQTSTPAHSISSSNTIVTARNYPNNQTQRNHFFNPVSNNVSNLSTTHQQPPPLVKVSTAPVSTVYTNSSYPQIYSNSNVTPMYSMAVPSTHPLNNSSTTAAVAAANKMRNSVPNPPGSNVTRYPPALTPINGTSTVIAPNNSSILANNLMNHNNKPLSNRTQAINYNQTGDDIIDLSSPPHSPQRTTSNTLNRNVVNPPPYGKSTNAPLPKINHVPEIVLTPGAQPYQISQCQAQGKWVTVINLDARDTKTKFATTLFSIHVSFCPRIDTENLLQIFLKVLCAEVHKGNSLQMKLLKDKHGQNSTENDLMLILLDDFNRLHRQLTYVYDNWNTPNSTNRLNYGTDAKRQKTS